MTDQAKPCTPEALQARINALEKMLDEREDRTKERFISMEKSVITALLTSDKAVSKAESATERRFEGVNEFRKTLADQAAMLMPRSEYNVQHTALMERTAGLERRVGTIEDRGLGKNEGLGFIGQIILGVIALLSAMGWLVPFLLKAH